MFWIGLAFLLLAVFCVYFKPGPAELPPSHGEMIGASLQHYLFTWPPSWDSLLDMDIEVMSRFADPITKRRAHLENFAHQNLSPARESFLLWLETSLANVAYMAIHAPRPYSESYQELVKDFVLWKRQQLQKVPTESTKRK